MMSDGSQLRQSWYDALNEAETHFRTLITSSSSSEWRRINNTTDSSSKGKARATTIPELSDVVIHRKSSRSGDDTYRLVLDVPTGDEPVSLDSWKAVLSTPELRQEWDPAVEDAHLVEMFDHTTRVCKTNFTLGWPANPRDSVTISRLFHDATTIIDISTSLPRSADEPAYLRPSPPYVRSNVTLFAWCIQHIPAQPLPPSLPSDPRKRKSSLSARLRITCFWQHDLRSIWNFGTSGSLTQQLCTMTLGLLKTVKKRGARVPTLIGHGHGVSIERIRFQVDREALTVDYAIVPEDEDHGTAHEHVKGLDELHAIREHRRLTRSIECILPSSDGWDVQVSTKASSEQIENLPWSAAAIRSSSLPSTSQASPDLDQILLRLSHAPLIDDHSILKVRLVIEVSGPSSGLRLNGLPHSIQDVEVRDPASYAISKQILQDVTSAADVSFNTSSSNTAGSIASGSTASTTLVRPNTERTAAGEKSVLSRVRRNYIYFSSLLQEPEAKWKRTTESRGVSITQLDSIDPTLVVYRAEATFVGVALWDLYGALVSPGARTYWDKQLEDAVLLEDVNELTELWHFKTKPAWPVTGRDAVVLKTVYKSPTTIHVFSFSADDPHLFPNIPSVDPNVIRTQVDLQGWAIEALSPTTTLLTLLEQSDPKGWTNKTSIPMQMINALAGIGEFAIKCGGPPVVTRLAGAKANTMRYDHERSSFKIEYEGSSTRRASSAPDAGSEPGPSTVPLIECEIRCDVDTWASSLDIVVDPPPQSISCLRRHRLSAEGGGLWLTLTHDAAFVHDERLLTIVRKGPGKEKGLVMVNGAKVIVDVEELPEHEIKSLTKRKRVKPPRIPLDQPPVMGVIRRRRAEWDADSEENADAGGTPKGNTSASWTAAPKVPSPLARFFTYTIDQAASTTQQAVAAMLPSAAVGEDARLSSSKPPMQYALETLAWVQESHSRFSSDGWVVVSDKGMSIRRKLSPEVSPVIPVHKGEKVIEGVSAEELTAVVSEYNCRRKWDDRYDSSTVLESFGAECKTSFIVNKCAFPFRDRGFYVASVVARAQAAPSTSRRNTSDTEHSNGTGSVVFCVSTSFSADSVALFSPSKYNPYDLPIGRVFVDAWVLETLDPYTTENYAIPSTRCTRLVAVDYAGSIPAAVNSVINAAIPRSVLAVEAYIKGISALPITRLPAAGLVLADSKGDEPPTHVAWHLRRRDESRLLLATAYAPDERAYRSTFLLTAPAPAPRSPLLKPAEQTTPRPSTLVLGAPPRARAATSPDRARAQAPTPEASPRARTPTSSPGPDAAAALKPRASSSAFTVKGEVRVSADLLVGEVVVDSKLYPGGYAVALRSRIRAGTAPLPLAPPPDDTAVLPIAYTLHTMPSSPLHSSGLNADKPTRHLLRMTLPTAQYQISTVQDPLTGETRSPPPKPQWLVDLEENGAVVDVEIKPLATGAETKGAPSEGALVVKVNGAEAVIIKEKESLTSLGRDELQDDKVSKMNVISRVMSDGESLPEELKVPIARAEDLLDTSALSPASALGGEAKAAEAAGAGLESPKETPGNQPPSDAATQPPIARTASNGLLGFLHSYPNPLSRFTTTPVRPSAINATSAPDVARDLPGGLISLDSATASAGHAHATYPLSTVLTVALIAFLIGSLLRSLLSPADFIYVVTDLQEAEEAEAGWREIRRLLEVKYLVGGWDFQVAVVRRH